MEPGALAKDVPTGRVVRVSSVSGDVARVRDAVTGEPGVRPAADLLALTSHQALCWRLGLGVDAPRLPLPPEPAR